MGTQPPPSAGGVLFYDNFDNGMNTAWWTNANSEGVWIVRGGRLTIDDDQAPNDLPLHIYAGNSLWQDYTVEMDVYSGGDAYQFAILIRVKDEDNLIAFFPWQGSYLRVRKGGIWEQIKTGGDVPCCTNYHLELTVKDNIFSAFVNADEVLTADISDFGAGYIGLQMADEWGNSISIDELKVTAR